MAQADVVHVGTEANPLVWPARNDRYEKTSNTGTSDGTGG
jgi:hypothetical protein